MKRCTREAIGAGIAVLLVAIGPAGALADGPTPRRAAAPEPPKPDWTLSANVGLASEYVFRGVSQSAENPAIQGGLDVAWRWLYAGVWASNLDFGGRANGRGVLKDVANIEIDTYAGIKHSLGRLDLDIGVIRYNYPNAFDQRIPSSTGFWFTEQRELDYVEAKVSVSTKLLDRVTVGATDLAGNVARPTRGVGVDVRYVSLGRRFLSVRPGGTVVVSVRADARSFRWRLGARSGVARTGTLRVVAPRQPGRFTLTVSVGSQSARAAVVVRRPPA